MTDYQVVETMITYGGSFVQALGKAYRCADQWNQERLKAAFPNLFDEYRELAELQEQRARERSA